MSKKIIKKILKWTGISLLLIIILLILTPIIFKDQIQELVIKEVNKNLTAELSLGEFDLTFFSTFPNMTVELYDTKLVGKDKFEGVELANIDKLQAHVGFWSVISGDQVEIDEIHITNPTFDVRVLEDGSANYDIVKPDSVKTPEELEEPSSFKLSLKEYSISNAKIKYDDKPLNIYMELDSLMHTGSGDLTADIIDFETTTEVDKVSYRMDGISYLTEVKTDAVVNLLMEFTDQSSKFTLKENSIKLNEIAFSVDGYYEMLDDHDEMDLKLNASEAKFKEFLSLIPAFYRSGYESMVASGSLALNGLVKGSMDDKNLPGWDFGLKVKNGSINYPDLPGKITNINVDGGSKFAGGADMDKMVIDVPKFHADLGKNSLDANLLMNNPMTDPLLKSGIKAYFDLSTLKDFMPVAEGESYSGIVDADVDINGRMSDLDKQDFEKFTAKGTVAVSNMKYSSSDLPNGVDINSLKLLFSPTALDLTSFDAKMGKSDFKMDGKIENYFGYMLRDEKLAGNFNFNSNNFDLDELMGTPEETAAAETTAETTEAASEEPFLVPGNLDFKLGTKINTLRYNNMDFKNVSGDVKINDEIASMENVQLETMGGKVGLRGSYNTQDHSKPKVDFGYKLNEIDIHELATNFVTVEKLAPITKFAQGKISSNMDFSSDLDKGLMPILSSLNSDGDIRSKAVTIEGFEMLEKIEAVTKLKNISKQTIQNFYTVFKVADGKVSVDPFKIKLGKIDTDVSGYTTLDKKVNYDLKMNVPKEEIPKEIIKVVEDAMGKLNALSPKLNVGELPAFIPLNIKVIGDAKNPTITHDFKEQVLKATGDFTDNMINSVKETVKDTVQAIVQEQMENLNEEKEKQKAKIMAEAQKEADKVKAEAKKAADAVRAEADRNAQKLINEAGSNPIKKKLAEEGAKKIRSEGEAKAKKIEDEGNKKADDIMAKAQAKADAI